MIGRRSGILAGLLGILVVVLTARTAAAAEPLIADLSKHLVAITTGFSGDDLLLFGAIDSPGDVIIVVRGHNQSVVVRRKARLGGIWVNSDKLELSGVPSFYAVASNRPLADIAPPVVLAIHEIGAERLRFGTLPGYESSAARTEALAAVARIKTRQGLYQARAGKLTFLSERLFRTDVHFPSNVPTGTYDVQVFLIRDGEVVNIKTTPLVVRKAGIGAAVFDFAYQHSALYGIVAVLIALLAGWAAEAVFRRT